MRKIEQDIIRAIREKRNFKTGYIHTPWAEGIRDKIVFRLKPEYTKDTCYVRLWDNLIAVIDFTYRKLTVSDCGYATQTTASRLNAVFAALAVPVSAVIRKGELKYSLNGNITNKNTVTAGGWNVTVL